MWTPTPSRLQSPSTSSTFWWCRPFAAPQAPVAPVQRRQPLPAWRRKALL
ncbi:hypothetical protein [Halopseudomonas xiamenensis]|nr:hypothetical protein [Halopseudomonas xiamenensis]